jgi:NAD(P)-dependent dehydrogenase (short-subunit alcohol dehydrogenase family)
MESPARSRPSLHGKIAVVTAAVGSLGREHCHALGAAGATVVVADFDQRSCDAFARDLERADVRAVSMPTDITDEVSVQKLADACLERFGSVDVLVNDACAEDDLPTQGSDGVGGFEHLSLPRWRRSLEVNVTGIFLSCRIVGGQMARRGRGGAIINASSKRAVVAAPAVLALSRFLAEHWGCAGVRVNTIVSSADPEEYRRALVFLASDASAGLTGFDLIVKTEDKQSSA